MILLSMCAEKKQQKETNNNKNTKQQYFRMVMVLTNRIQPHVKFHLYKQTNKMPKTT